MGAGFVARSGSARTSSPRLTSTRGPARRNLVYSACRRSHGTASASCPSLERRAGAFAGHALCWKLFGERAGPSAPTGAVVLVGRDVGRDIDLHHSESLGVGDSAPEWRRRHSPSGYAMIGASSAMEPAIQSAPASQPRAARGPAGSHTPRPSAGGCIHRAPTRHPQGRRLDLLRGLFRVSGGGRQGSATTSATNGTRTATRCSTIDDAGYCPIGRTTTGSKAFPSPRRDGDDAVRSGALPTNERGIWAYHRRWQVLQDERVLPVCDRGVGSERIS